MLFIEKCIVLCTYVLILTCAYDAFISIWYLIRCTDGAKEQVEVVNNLWSLGNFPLPVEEASMLSTWDSCMTNLHCHNSFESVTLWKCLVQVLCSSVSTFPAQQMNHAMLCIFIHAYPTFLHHEFLRLTDTICFLCLNQFIFHFRCCPLSSSSWPCKSISRCSHINKCFPETWMNYTDGFILPIQ